MLGLIALFATLQYKWLGRISDAEREHMRATLNTRASGFEQDFDGELTRAYLLFQVDPQAGGSLDSRIALRVERWQATARYPRLIKEVYTVQPGERGALQRFKPTTRTLEPVDWPAAMDPIRQQLSKAPEQESGPPGLVVRSIPSPIWERVPALVIPTPQFSLNQQAGRTEVRMIPGLSYIVVLIDRGYIIDEMLPALAQQHFRQTGDGFDYQLAVVSTADRNVVYRSTTAFTPSRTRPWMRPWICSRCGCRISGRSSRRCEGSRPRSRPGRCRARARPPPSASTSSFLPTPDARHRRVREVPFRSMCSRTLH